MDINVCNKIDKVIYRLDDLDVKTTFIYKNKVYMILDLSRMFNVFTPDMLIHNVYVINLETAAIIWFDINFVDFEIVELEEVKAYIKR